jgi:hypothetical protein
VKHGYHYTTFYETYNITWHYMNIVIGQLGSSPGHSSGITAYFLSTSQLELWYRNCLRQLREKGQTRRQGLREAQSKAQRGGGVGKTPGFCQLASVL